jgi:hypothetical protein
MGEKTRKPYQETVLVGFSHPRGTIPTANDKLYVWALDLRRIKSRAWVEETTFLGFAKACKRVLGDVPLLDPDTIGAETISHPGITNSFVDMVRLSQWKTERHCSGIPPPVKATLWAHIFVPEDKLQVLRLELQSRQT